MAVEDSKVSLRGRSHCCLVAAGAAARAQLHAHPGGELGGLPPPVSPSGNAISTHTHKARGGVHMNKTMHNGAALAIVGVEKDH